MHEQYKNHINTKHGRLTIKDFVYDPNASNYQQKFKFLCDCDCGVKNKLILCYAILKRGQKSCGCLRKGIASKTEQKYKINYAETISPYYTKNCRGILN